MHLLFGSALRHDFGLDDKITSSEIRLLGKFRSRLGRAYDGTRAPPVKGGLLDREACQLVESARKGVFFYFDVVQRSMNGHLPGNRKRGLQAQKMRVFVSYIVVFFSVLKAHRHTLPHGLEARTPGSFGLKGCAWCPRLGSLLSTIHLLRS